MILRAALTLSSRTRLAARPLLVVVEALVTIRNSMKASTVIMPPVTGVNTGVLKWLWSPSIRENSAHMLQKKTRGRYRCVKVAVSLCRDLEQVDAVHRLINRGVVSIVRTENSSRTRLATASSWLVQVILLLALLPTWWISRGTNIVPRVLLIMSRHSMPGTAPFREQVLEIRQNFRVVATVMLCRMLAICEIMAFSVTTVSELTRPWASVCVIRLIRLILVVFLVVGGLGTVGLGADWLGILGVGALGVGALGLGCGCLSTWYFCCWEFGVYAVREFVV